MARPSAPSATTILPIQKIQRWTLAILLVRANDADGADAKSAQLGQVAKRACASLPPCGRRPFSLAEITASACRPATPRPDVAPGPRHRDRIQPRGTGWGTDHPDECLAGKIAPQERQHRHHRQRPRSFQFRESRVGRWPYSLCARMMLTVLTQNLPNHRSPAGRDPREMARVQTPLGVLE
jgi:hypothetical protein